MSCSLYEEKLSAFVDKALPDAEMAMVSLHVSSCAACASVVSKISEVSDWVDLLEPSGVVGRDHDFTRTVMARIGVIEPARVATHRLYRIFSFVGIFILYALYVLHTADWNGQSAKMEFSRDIVIFNLALAGLALAFVFFSNEMIGFNSKFLVKFSDKYRKVSSLDIWMSRLIGVAILVGLLTHKLVFATVGTLFIGGIF